VVRTSLEDSGDHDIGKSDALADEVGLVGENLVEVGVQLGSCSFALLRALLVVGSTNDGEEPVSVRRRKKSASRISITVLKFEYRASAD
jgi:hypothetical protein